MAEIKLSDLPYGSLNNLEDNSSGDSGDRRRTGATTFLRFAVEKVFGKDTLDNVAELNGVIVSYRPVAYPSYKNRTAMFEEFVYKINETGDEESAEEKPKKYASFAYKVYIPELECRPAPKSFNDPVLITYPDIYSDIEGTQNLPLELGTLVAVKYEDINNLFNPRIVRKVGGPIQIENIASEAINEAFRKGIPAPLGSVGGNTTPSRLGSRYSESVFKETFNWKPADRKPQDIKWIVMHTTEISTLEASRRVLSGFNDKTGEFMDRKVSAHYLVGPQGEIYNMVADTDISWHAGKTGDGRVYGSNSIGIEVVGYAAEPSTWNEKNINALTGLIKYLTETYNIPLVYEGLRPNAAFDGSPPTGEQRNLSSGLISHSRSTLEGRRYDPGIYFPYEKIFSAINETDVS